MLNIYIYWILYWCNCVLDTFLWDDGDGNESNGTSERVDDVIWADERNIRRQHGSVFPHHDGLRYILWVKVKRIIWN